MTTTHEDLISCAMAEEVS